MVSGPLARCRFRLSVGLIFGMGLAVAWVFSPGVPVLWGPSAKARSKAAGKALFEHEWTEHDPLAKGDGLGPVFNASSCVACHFQGGVGGSGPNERNVLTFEVLPVAKRPKVVTGVIHAASVSPEFRETRDLVRELFPVVRGGVRGQNQCSYQVPDFDPLRIETLNTPALFGAGWIDHISDKAVKQQPLRHGIANALREFKLDFTSIPTGRPRILAGGRVGKFGWKGQFANLEEFVAAACANEVGLGNPLMPQATPIARPGSQPETPDLDRKQFVALVAFVTTLPKPAEVVPNDASAAARARHGRQVFEGIGCAVCHTPDLGGVRGLYTDLLLHRVEGGLAQYGSYGSYGSGPSPVPLPDDYPLADEWKTPPLWGVADSAPYFHDGLSPTLEDAVLRHGLDAAEVTHAYVGLSSEDQAALIAFLRTLRAPGETEPAAALARAR